MKKTVWISILIPILLLAGCDAEEIQIKVESPFPNQTIESPFLIKGEARGTWFFEASFPVELVGENGGIILETFAQAKEDWMTENFVPFEATLRFESGENQKGTLILQKDNPSGLPQNDDKIEIPILFKQEPITVEVFFGTEKTGNAPNFDCTEVSSVQRTIPKTKAVAKAALEELLKGPLAEEKGYFTSINENVKIQKLTIENGTAKVDFDAELEKAVGGSCRTASIRSQITKTLKQFPTVKDVLISIDGRTEDILQP